jgi:hypothetical protein
MRTFPKSLATFRKIVEDRGKRLREVAFADLQRIPQGRPEHLTVESRPATIGTIVQQLPSGGLRVVIQGFIKARILGHHVALDGFYKYPDETLAAMTQEDFYEFD